MCLSVTLFWTHLFFLLANSLAVFEPYCAVFAPLLHFGFLSTFFWTSVLSFDIWKNVVTARLSSRKRSGLVVYGFIAWGVPALVVSVGILLDRVAPNFPLSPTYGRYSCWIGSSLNQFVFFTMPMTLLLLFDIGLYVHIVVHVRKTAKRAAAFDFKGGDSMSNMALFVKLAFIMGITWILAFINLFFAIFVLDIAVIVLVGLQGVYLFFGFKDYAYLLPKKPRKKKGVVPFRRSLGIRCIDSQLDICAAVICRPGRVCRILDNGLASCQCVQHCPSHYKPVCGTNGVTYDNHCQLHKDACVRQKHISIKHKGVCKKSKVKQSHHKYHQKPGFT
ncbi:hypothetical protein HPB52_016868 [Rhipicephalus sanguineus]|uniref:G-protein coupled receptors family 2 profile 2 domain-containing protein n=1 Tax=Rhipicephalus sanguineus TaxID=34632 RepID=A0A9D4PRR2_RHISA|nr:hypothetical protein HPB52_016868 [Rhipicephalus sanguineus]